MTELRTPSPVPASPTIVDLVRTQANRHGDRTMYRYLPSGDVDGPVDTLSFAGLDRRARAIAARLQAEGAEGDRTLLLFPSGLDFICGFLGSLYARRVAVPAYPPEPARLDRTLPRLRAIARDCGANVVLTTSAIAALAEGLTALAPDLARLRWIAVDAVSDDEANRWADPGARPGDVAFLQYTSGSTGTPKGVVLSHGNLLANQAQIQRAFGHDERSSFFGWLPLFHDMGLIGNVLQPLYLGSECTLISPMDFLQGPVRWLQAIARYRAHTSGGPNFAFDLVARKATDAELAALDLSCWTVAFNGAEPIRDETLRRFADRLAPCGFRREAIYPCYGLAEAALLVSGSEKLGGWRRATLDVEALERGEITPAPQGRAVLAIGRPVDATDVAIVHPETCLPAAPHEVGEIWVRGPQVARGYWGLAEETERTFGARLADTDVGPYLRTGDLGFFRDGQLHCAGRLKDLLILRGRNHYPHDLELTVERSHPAVRPGAVAAFALTDGEEEALAVVAEIDTRRAQPSDAEAILAAMREAIVREHEIRPARLVLIPPGRIPKTSSGKIQRRACRAELSAGQLEIVGSLPPVGAPVALPKAHAGLYGRLDVVAPRIDERSTRYRFDLDALPWAQKDGPGDYLPRGLATQMFGREIVDALAATPRAWDVLQWVGAMGLCDLFIQFEQMAIRFVHGERVALGDRRSLHLLVDEERKHIAMFERYRAALAARHPEWRAVYDRHYAPVVRDIVQMDDRSRYETELEYHFALWVKVLFFEEYTIWLHERLRAEKDAVQPLWYEVHAAHAREEAQHVVTDQAWLRALVIDDADREAWSKRLLAELLKTFGMPVMAETAACVELLPGLGKVAEAQRAERPLLLSLFAEKAFRRSAELVPHFGRIARDVRADAHQVVTQRGPSARAASQDEIAAWVEAWLRANLHLTGAIARTASFAELGLESVDAVSLSGDLGAFLGCRLSATVAYECPTLALLSERLATALARDATAPAVATAPLSRTPASARQRRLRAVDLAHPGHTLAHVTTVYTFEGALDVAALVEACRALAERHPALRTSFVDVADGDVDQRVSDTSPIELRIRLDPLGDRLVDEATRLALDIERRPYDLTCPPLVRLGLLRGDARRHALVVGLHHIITDGWSMAVLMADLFALYAAFARSEAPALPALTTSPLAVAREEGELLGSDEGARRLAFWRARLLGHADVERPRSGHAFRGHTVRRTLSPDALGRLQQFATRHDASLFTTLTAAITLALRARTGSDDVGVDTHLFDRASADRKPLVGYLVNILPLRTDLAGVARLGDALERVRRSWLDALAHELPIDHVVRQLWPDRYATRWMPSSLAFNMLPWAYGTLGDEQMRVERLAPALPHPSFLYYDRMLVAQPHGDALALVLWHNLEAVSAPDAEAFLDDLVRVLDEEARAR